MCGFFGIVSSSENISTYSNQIDSAISRINHRGPDQKDIFFGKRFALGCVRLSIIDLSIQGNQPMVAKNEGVVLGFNGEIYNYKEIRNILVSKGYKFIGFSDTEVLKNAFLEWGNDCVHHLRGMFSFIVWCEKKQKLFAFVDRFGIKPLFYVKYKDLLILSSEIKAILDFLPGEKKINEKSIFKFLSRGWADTNEQTFFKNIKRLPASSLLNFSLNQIEVKKYWKLKFKKELQFDKNYFSKAFQKNISLHLNSDVSIATTLAGGLDSSSITSISSKLLGAKKAPHAFSIIPPHTEDESILINEIVKDLGIKHTYCNYEEADFINILDQVIQAHDEPFLTSSAIYQFILRKHISSLGYKVLLVGEGGDELLGGYRRMVYPYMYSLKQKGENEVLNTTLNKLESFLGISKKNAVINLSNYSKMIELEESGQENTEAYSYLHENFIKKHYSIIKKTSYPIKKRGEKNRFFSHLVYHMFKRDIPYVLRMEDRNSMAHSIESRVPFLDHVFADFIFKHNFVEFMSEGMNKSMLRRSMKGNLPDLIINNRQKHGRPGNNSYFVYKLLYGKILQMIDSDLFKEYEWFKKNTLKIRLTKDQKEYNDKSAPFWFRYYVLGRWMTLKIA